MRSLSNLRSKWALEKVETSSTFSRRKASHDAWNQGECRKHWYWWSCNLKSLTSKWNSPFLVRSSNIFLTHARFFDSCFLRCNSIKFKMRILFLINISVFTFGVMMQLISNERGAKIRFCVEIKIQIRLVNFCGEFAAQFPSWKSAFSQGIYLLINSNYNEDKVPRYSYKQWTPQRQPENDQHMSITLTQFTYIRHNNHNHNHYTKDRYQNFFIMIGILQKASSFWRRIGIKS